MKDFNKDDDCADQELTVARTYLANQDEILLEPFNYISKIDTDVTWRQLAKAFNYWLKVPEDKFEVIDESYRKFYYANLLIDDIQNDSALRGNKQTAHTVYGFACTLNSSWYAFILAASKLISFNSPQTPTTAEYLDKVEKSCIARWIDLYWRDTFTCPTQDEYFQMIVTKSYGLFTSEIKSMQFFSKSQGNFDKLSAILGLFLHLLKDYEFFQSADETESKFYHEDITIAGFSLPIIHALNNETDGDEKIMSILRQRTKNRETKKYFISLLEKNGGLEYTRKVLIQLREEALLEMQNFEKNPFMEDFIENYLNVQLSATEVSDNGIEPINISSYIDGMDNPDDNLVAMAKKELLKPFKHIDSNNRSKVMLSMLRMFNNTYRVPRKTMAIIVDALRYYGYLILMVDDLQDHSFLRHGMPCAHLIFGISNTINSGFYIQATCTRQLIKLEHQQVLESFYNEEVYAFRGQGLDVYWRDNFICPTEEEYMYMIDGKTCSFMRTGTVVAKPFGTNNIDISKLATPSGLFFQIQNDYENLNNRNSVDKKTFCEDISEGKFSCPVVHAINSDPEKGKEILNILRQRTHDVELIKYCISLIEKCGSLEYTKNKVLETRAELFTICDEYEDGEVLKKILTTKFKI